jgi:hypothetical protein
VFLATNGFTVHDPASLPPYFANSPGVVVSAGGLTQLEEGLGRWLIRYLKPAEERDNR